jgi:hypothetical protein
VPQIYGIRIDSDKVRQQLPESQRKNLMVTFFDFYPLIFESVLFIFLPS